MTTFRISGRVIDQKTRQGLAARRVEAWDKDLIHDDWVGSAVTDEQGVFQIAFDESDFKELFLDQRPDLFFKVFHEDKLIKNTEDSVLWNVDTGNTQITIAIEETIMASDPHRFDLSASNNAINVIGGNPGFTFSADDLQAIAAGTLVLANPPGFSGINFQPKCITALRYQNNDQDLVRIAFDDGTVYTSAEITNLNDFQERFQEAANFGHGCTFCVRADGTMFMLNIFPCRCQCEKNDQPGPTIPPVVTAPVP